MLPTAAPPSQDLVLQAGLLAGLASALVYLGFVQPRLKRRLEVRLATYLTGNGSLRLGSSAAPSLSARRVAVSPLVAAFARVATRLVSGAQLARLRLLLIQAVQSQ